MYFLVPNLYHAVTTNMTCILNFPNNVIIFKFKVEFRIQYKRGGGVIHLNAVILIKNLEEIKVISSEQTKPLSA